jgi:hypothetical protein
MNMLGEIRWLKEMSGWLKGEVIHRDTNVKLTFLLVAMLFPIHDKIEYF